MATLLDRGSIPLISTKIEAYTLRNKPALTDKFVIIRL